jgi:hypothetical protein
MLAARRRSSCAQRQAWRGYCSARGRAAEGRETLRGPADAFTEGDNLSDLRQARMLLAALPAV